MIDIKKTITEKIINLIKKYAKFEKRNPNSEKYNDLCCPYCGSDVKIWRNSEDERDWFLEASCKNINCTKGHGPRRFCNMLTHFDSKHNKKFKICSGWPWKQGRVDLREIISKTIEGVITQYWRSK